MAETIELMLEPKKLLSNAERAGEALKQLGNTADAALKKTGKALGEAEGNAERFSGKTAGFFRNLGTRIKEDLKTAFDVGGIVAGGKFANEMNKGVKSVFDMERAFDRLNSRLRLSAREFGSFKIEMGRKVAGAGANLEDVMPGVETVAAKGGVRNAGQLGEIGEMLARASKTTTGEDVDALAGHVVEILKVQGKQVTAANFRAVLDTLQGTRVAGAFHTGADAGAAVVGLAPYAKLMGLNTRQMGGLAAQAGKSGESGQSILRQLMEQASAPGGMQRLNAVLGQDIFKNGKFNAGALGKVDTGKFGQYSQQVMESATGLQGTSGGDFKRFIEAFKEGTTEFDAVVNGSNETAEAFGIATQSFASKLDRFRAKTVEATREIGEGMVQVGEALFKGNLGEAGAAAKRTGGAVADNAGTLAAALGISAVVGAVAGKGLKGLLGGGALGGLAGGMVGGQAAKAAGVTPVYVVNAAEIGSGLGKAAGVADALMGGGIATKLAKVGTLAAGAGGVGLAGAAGYAAGTALNEVPGVSEGAQGAMDYVAKAFGGRGIVSDQEAIDQAQTKQAHELALKEGVTDQIAMAIIKGMEQAKVKVEHKGPITHVSDVKGRGGTR